MNAVCQEDEERRDSRPGCCDEFHSAGLGGERRAGLARHQASVLVRVVTRLCVITCSLFKFHFIIYFSFLFRLILLLLCFARVHALARDLLREHSTSDCITLYYFIF